MKLKKTVAICRLTLVAALLAGCSASRQTCPSLKTISFVDRNGMTETISNADRLEQYQHVDYLKHQPYQKVLRIFSRDGNGDIHSYLTSYHPNGQPKQYLEVVNSRAFGTYQEWHENGELKLCSTAIGGEADLDPVSERSWLFDGEAKVWDEEGNLIADINYQNGAMHGPATYYHPNGAVWRHANFHNNALEGVYEVYLDDGKLLQKMYYQQGKKWGPAYRYWNEDRIAGEEEYQNDYLPQGFYYNLRGDLISRVDEGSGYRPIFGKSDVVELHEYRHGLQEGEVSVYDRDHGTVRKYSVLNNQKHGVEIEYYEGPHIRHLPKLSITWYEGNIQGIVKTWYDNGIQESNREMNKNTKHGISTAWYRDGSLMLIEEYDRDKLVKGEYFRKGQTTPTSVVYDGKGVATLFDSEGHFTQKVSYLHGAPFTE